MTGHSTTRTSTRRQPSIDVLRAFAIVLMIVVHFVENLSGRYGQGDGPFTGVQGLFWLPTGFAAPTFTLLSGVSYRMWLEDEIGRGRRDEAIAKATIRRGLFLLGLGFAFNILVWLPEDVFNWDGLTLIGCGILAHEVARRLPASAVLFTAAVIIAVTPALQRLADHAAYWTTGHYDYDFTTTDVLLGWLVTGYFPIFPWLAFPLAGSATAPWLVGSCSPATSGIDRGPDDASGTDRRRHRIPPACGPFVLVGAAATLLACWPSLPTAVTGDAARAWMMFPPTLVYVLGTLGAVTALLRVLHLQLDDDPSRFAPVVAWATPLSRRALSLYLLHHVVHVWPMWIAGLVTTGRTDGLWQRALPVSWSLGCAVAFMVAASVLCRWADARRLPSVESWMRWICD
ncbi:MAG: heparan-alpha-glucosaminide N-acetyltransferase domain-containing protein [Planctomycetia bacterium]